MRYFYIYPFKIQYYFSSDYRRFPFILDIFVPYSSFGRFFWWFWNNVIFLKYFFVVNESKIPNLNVIKSYLGDSKILAVNNGTKGPEQKSTAIFCLAQNNKTYFLKFAESEKARNLVINEYSILLKLQQFPGIPKIFNFTKSPIGILLETEFLIWKKYNKRELTHEIFILLLELSKISLEGCSDYTKGFSGKKGFAHGDFCPWNMLVNDNNVKLIDWELAGQYPAGYDLFTFIFQSSFLLRTKIVIKKILGPNLEYIQEYFRFLGQPDWEHFLLIFAKFKYEQESLKQNKKMMMAYKQIIEYAEET